MSSPNVTRGHGLLEGFLARRRAKMADRLIPGELRAGRILDVGCGSSPFFLGQTRFAERYGVDKMVPASADPGPNADGLRLAHFDVDTSDRLPFDDAFFDTVTMLAVFEHIKMDRLILLLDEIHRVLKPGGVYVLTTPAGWTGPILDTMKLLRLVSPEEIDEHEDSYSRKKIRAVIARTKLATCDQRFGLFECGMNVWGVVRK